MSPTLSPFWLKVGEAFFCPAVRSLARSPSMGECREPAMPWQHRGDAPGPDGAGRGVEGLGRGQEYRQEATGAATSLQLSQTSSTEGREVVRLVRDLARKDGSSAVAHLAFRMSSAMRSHDPFGKIKGLIADVFDQLESEAAADAAHKVYCDKEPSETNTKSQRGPTRSRCCRLGLIA